MIPIREENIPCLIELAPPYLRYVKISTCRMSESVRLLPHGPRPLIISTLYALLSLVLINVSLYWRGYMQCLACIYMLRFMGRTAGRAELCVSIYVWHGYKIIGWRICHRLYNITSWHFVSLLPTKRSSFRCCYSWYCRRRRVVAAGGCLIWNMCITHKWRCRS